VFCENNITFPSDDLKTEIEKEAVKAVTCLGLDFGAVDLIVSKGDNLRVFILEVNTRPGIESTRLRESYANAIRTKVDAL
jgi:D-alanine-D-alanine ligase-like ATP-grasp enzyme